MVKELNMQTASHTTESTAKHAPKPVAGRIVTSHFRKHYFKFCTDNPILGVALVPASIFGQALWLLPSLLKARAAFKKKKRDPQNPRVFFWTDTLDEVNGIANNIRLTVKKQIDKGRKAHLIGAVHRTRDGGRVENSFVILFPLAFGMPQLGYPDSELSAPHMGPILRWFLRYPPDVVELDTPNPGSWVVMVICKFLGIPVISHYRTDANGYTRMLVKWKFMHLYVHFLVWSFTRLTTPVITPSRDFKRIVREEMGIPDSKIALLPRGIELASFYPERKSSNTWPSFSKANRAVRFLFVGRVSLEKSLPFQEEVWKEFRQHNSEAELMIVGHGPYLDTMKERMADCPEVSFTGQLSGESLFNLYAEADYFIFVSGNDTFGNVIVEALASGTPALISDRGGPKDIVEGTDCGVIIPFRDKEAWVSALQQAVRRRVDDPNSFEELRKRCVAHSKKFSLDSACDAQWEFMTKLAQGKPWQ